MTVINKRNAVVGYLTIKTGKVVARRKAKQVGSKLAPWGSKNGNSKNGKNKKSD
ncbi:MAG TPA: hypothetical protein VGH18_03445 [Gaiellaceae bacterium]|jgi:hypothetical protein